MDEPELEGPKGFRSRVHGNGPTPNQNIGAGFTQINFPGVPIYDTLGEFFVATSSFRPRRPGWYLLGAQVEYRVGGGLAPQFVMRLVVGGVTQIARAQFLGQAGVFMSAQCFTVERLAAGDAVTVEAAFPLAPPNGDVVDATGRASFFVAHRLS